jgi:hypothetical protein
MRNRIINGGMTIDQRNGGAAVTVNSSTNPIYTLDRWQGRQEGSSGAFTVQRSTDAPSGFVNSLIATVTTADASVTSSEGYAIYQVVEGFNSSDLGWGTANAQTITISFWVRSSVTGSFSLMLINSAFARNYGALYTINSANTWEYKTVVIPGDTSGTWLTDNGVGIRVGFGLGAGSDRTASVGWSTPAVSNTKTKVTGGVDWIATSGATFYITGVQLEKGSTATPFEFRSIGTELALCQRYYEHSFGANVAAGTATTDGRAILITGTATNNAIVRSIDFCVEKRTAPTMTSWDASGNSGRITTFDAVTVATQNVTPTVPFGEISTKAARFGNAGASRAGIACSWAASSEL